MFYFFKDPLPSVVITFGAHILGCSIELDIPEGLLGGCHSLGSLPSKAAALSLTHNLRLSCYLFKNLLWGCWSDSTEVECCMKFLA